MGLAKDWFGAGTEFRSKGNGTELRPAWISLPTRQFAAVNRSVALRLTSYNAFQGGIITRELPIVVETAFAGQNRLPDRRQDARRPMV